MAVFKEKFFGKVSGAFGDFVGIVRGNDNYIRRKKTGRKIDNSPAGIERRNKFAVAIKAAKAVNSAASLRSIWLENAGGKLTANNHFIKYNYKYVEGSGTKPGFSLLPGIGFAFSVDSFERTENNITVTVLPLVNSTSFDTEVEKDIEAHFLVELKNPESEDGEKVLFFMKSAPKQALDLNNPLTFSTDFQDTDTSLLQNYPNVIVHSVFCTLDADDSPVQYSSTYSQ